jgi:hypothetical protein
MRIRDSETLAERLSREHQATTAILAVLSLVAWIAILPAVPGLAHRLCDCKPDPRCEALIFRLSLSRAPELPAGS